MIYKLSRLGHPVLREITRPVDPNEIGQKQFQELVENVIETMRDYDGVGLAAPQVHLSLQLAVMEVEENPRYPGMPPLPLTVMINPKLTLLSHEVQVGWEGCLSIPDLRGKVPRYRQVKVEALDREGKPFALELSGFHAVVAQHEIDHLMGKVYLDRMDNMHTLSFLREFYRYWTDDEGEVEEEG